jgi:hypothetical protein
MLAYFRNLKRIHELLPSLPAVGREAEAQVPDEHILFWP